MFAKTKIRTALVLQAALVLVMSASALQAVPVFTLTPPSGGLAGTPGDTVGWGFSLGNTTDYVIVTNSAFCEGAGPFTAADIGTAACGSAYASFGTYSDYIATTFGNLGISIGTPNPPDPNGGPACAVPGTSTNCDTTLLVQSFDSTLMTGVGQFVIAPGASGTLSGQILVTYDLFSVSPNNPAFNPDTDLIATDQAFNANASITVVPEPATFLLMGSALAGLLVRRKLSRRGRS